MATAVRFSAMDMLIMAVTEVMERMLLLTALKLKAASQISMLILLKLRLQRVLAATAALALKVVQRVMTVWLVSLPKPMEFMLKAVPQ